MKKCRIYHFFVLLLSVLIAVAATAQAKDERVTSAFQLKVLAPELASDGLSAQHAKPPLVVVADPRPEMQGLRREGLTAAMAVAAPERATASFTIDFIPGGGSDPWGQSCQEFPAGAKSAFQAAAAIWANTVQSSVPISFRACWPDLGSPVVLGYSGGGYIVRNFSGAPRAATWYSESLANSLAGYEIVPGAPDMNITYNSGFSWYFGTDGNTPAGQYDLVSVATHEIGHGLNFTGMASYTGGIGSFGYAGSPDIYETFMESGSGTPLISYANPSTALGSLLTSNNLWFNGTNANAANGGTRVKIYAPSTWSGGSSYAHLDYATFAGTINRMMVYAMGSGSSIHDPGPVTRGLLQDLGWQLASIDLFDLSGVVLDGSTTGPPLAGATVTIAGRSRITGSTGTFTITDIPAGTYTVTISKSGYTTKTITDYVLDSDKSGVVFFLTPADTTPPVVTQFVIPATSSSLTVPITTFTATDNVGVTGYLVNESAVKPSASASGWSATAPASYTFTSTGTKTLYAWAKDAAGNVSNSLSGTVAIGGLPAGWGTLDINTAVAGSTSYAGGTFTVIGAGANIGGTADGFRYAYQTLAGNGQIVARVVSLQNTDPYAKAGVMFRQSLTANSPNVSMLLTPTSGAQMSWRSTTGGTSSAVGRSGKAAPYWVKVARSGDTFTTYMSADGANWVLVYNAAVTMPSTVYVGLAVTSHNTAALCTATFDSISISGPDLTPPVVTSFGVPSTSSSLTVPVSMTATDNVGVTGYLVNESSTTPSASASGWSAAAPTSYTFASAGTKTLYAWAKDAAGNVSNSLSASVTVTTGGGLPSPWVTQDINTGLPGSAGYSGGTFTVGGAGANIGGTADGFRYVYQPMMGNGQIVARVVTQQNTDPYAKAGVMFREALTAGSAHVTMALTPTSGAQLVYRSTTGGSSSAIGRSDKVAPYWVKLARSGNTFTSYMSPDGVNWTLVTNTTVTMSSTVYVGLAVTSHTTATVGTATFDNVSTGIDTIPPVVTAFSVPSSSSSLTVPITTLTATDNVGVTGYLVNESSGKPSASGSGWSASPPASYTVASSGLKVLYAWAKDGAGNVSDSLSATVQVTGTGGLPAGWSTQDINTALAGSASYAGGTFTVSGAGANIGGTADGFRFAYKTLTGDGQIVARVVSQQNTDPYAKAGVMFRESLTAGSVHVTMALTPTSGAQMVWRSTTGGSTSAIGRSGIVAPYWVKMVRSGSNFTTYMSADGINWTLVSSQNVVMPGTVYVGLAVTSHNTAALGTATFDNVQ